MPRRSRYASQIRAIADAQSGIAATFQMRASGVPSAAISRWSKPGGVLRRVLPATYVWGHGPLTQEQREMAAMAYAHFAAQITGVAALARYGVRDLPVPLEVAPVQLLVPEVRGLTSQGFVIVERTIRLPNPTTTHSHPLAPAPRALFDACRRHHLDRRSVRATVLECLRDSLVTPDDIAEEIRAGQRRWTTNLRSALDDFLAGVASAPEAETRDDLIAAGLTSFVWNADLYTPEGEFIGRPDGYDPSSGLALEVDSRRHHSDPADWEKTLRRNARFAAVGIVVISVIPSHLRTQPQEVVDQIRQALAALQGRKAPRVVVRLRQGELAPTS
jgi:hypothetical protein